MNKVEKAKQELLAIHANHRKFGSVQIEQMS